MISKEDKAEFTLIICTYQRPRSLVNLLISVEQQSLYPNQILVVDGSEDNETLHILRRRSFRNLEYFKVDQADRGLTNQRNFGVRKVSELSSIVCFLDDDTELLSSYFENLISTYNIFPNALGVGGYILDEVKWRKQEDGEVPGFKEFAIDGFIRSDSSRFLLRKKLGLMPNTFPTFMPLVGHGRSVGFLPPSGKTYKVETFMGGVSSYKKEVFDNIKFSEFFKGYSLYEDTDFTLRLSQLGDLYINTSANLYHLHNEDGRPNQFKYGKMVVRNGWYVWRVKYPRPLFRDKFEWHLITGLLILIRLSNVFTTKNKKQALTEGLGRIIGWWSIVLRRPEVITDKSRQYA